MHYISMILTSNVIQGDESCIALTYVRGTLCPTTVEEGAFSISECKWNVCQIGVLCEILKNIVLGSNLRDNIRQTENDSLTNVV